MNSESQMANEQFYDAQSTTSQDADEPNAGTDLWNETTNETAKVLPAQAANKRTVLSYSDKSGSWTETTRPNSNSRDRQIDDYNDDFKLSNRLNDIVLSNSLELHYFVYHNDLESVKNYIKKYENLNDPTKLSDYLSIRDIHGNTPLHLAAMFGHVEIAKVLVAGGAVVKARNKQLWTPLNEAISYGDRDLIKSILVKFEKEVETILNDSKPKIVHALKDMIDFYVEIKWDFESWIPLVSRFLPSDVCKLYKSGTKLRLDCTLGDIAHKATSGGGGGSQTNENQPSNSPFNWQRGDLTFLFDIEKIGDKNSIIFMDNKKKTFCYVDKQEELNSASGDDIQLDEVDIEKEIDLLLSREMIHIKLDTKLANFVPTQVGWFNKRDKIEEINGYTCQFFDVSNLYIISKLRNEHLSEEEIKKQEEKQKKMKERLKNSQSSSSLKKSKSKNSSSDLNSLNSKNNNNNNNNNNNPAAEADLEDVDLENGAYDYDDFYIEHRPSLTPPNKTNVSWNEYISADEVNWPHLGRKIRSKESKKEFKAQLAMSQQFPLTINDLNNLLEALAPLAKFRKLKEFINLKLPPGFPVKIDIPIVHTVTAKVSFQNFKKKCNHDAQLFKVPESYREENIHDALFKDKNNSSPKQSSSSIAAAQSPQSSNQAAAAAESSSLSHF